jgi:hypothetical protein
MSVEHRRDFFGSLIITIEQRTGCILSPWDCDPARLPIAMNNFIFLISDEKQNMRQPAGRQTRQHLCAQAGRRKDCKNARSWAVRALYRTLRIASLQSYSRFYSHKRIAA